MRFLLFSLLFLPLHIFAQNLPYADITPDAWFADEVEGFLDEGYLDPSQENFRSGDSALRSEFLKLIVELNGGILDELPTESSFSDVSVGAWFFGYVEEAAREGWIRGDGNCYRASPFDSSREPVLSRSRSAELAPASAPGASAGRQDDICNARPADPITRAEAAALIRRAFGKTRLGKAPAFSDNPAGSWFTDVVQAAADHCILRGDDGARTVRPHDPLNRAEMVVMLWRVDHGGVYPDC